MSKGTDKWLNERKGFCFVDQEKGPDMFVHHSAIAACLFKSLNDGDNVSFEIGRGPKGPRCKECHG